MESEFNDEARFNRLAAELVAEGSYAEAEALLEAAIQSMPSGWKPEENDGRHLTVAFWDQEEFVAYVRNHPLPNSRSSGLTSRIRGRGTCRLSPRANKGSTKGRCSAWIAVSSSNRTILSSGMKRDTYWPV